MSAREAMYNYTQFAFYIRILFLFHYLFFLEYIFWMTKVKCFERSSVNSQTSQTLIPWNLRSKPLILGFRIYFTSININLIITVFFSLLFFLSICDQPLCFYRCLYGKPYLSIQFQSCVFKFHVKVIWGQCLETICPLIFRCFIIVIVLSYV